jgi:hypothetical protein
MSSRKTFNRAKEIIQARQSDPATAINVERDIAKELVGSAILDHDSVVRPRTFPQHGYLSPMAATEAFAQELQKSLTHLASNLNVKPPSFGKYNPLVASQTLSREVWRSRQVVDDLCIPYPFYCQYAVFRWYELGNKRMPRPSQLTNPEIALHVMGLWIDPQFQNNYLLFNDWNPKFNAANYIGDAWQDRALSLIERRIRTSHAVYREPAAELVEYLDVNISEAEARRRFGHDVVDNALGLRATALAEREAVGEGLEELLKSI